MRRPRHRRQLIVSADFFASLDTIPGLLYWPYQETSGTNIAAKYNGVFNSAYDATAISTTVGQPGFNDILSHSFDAINDVNNHYSAALSALWDGSTGTWFGFVQADSAGATAGELYIASLLADGSNFYTISKNSTANQYRIRTNTAGNFNAVTPTLPDTEFHYLVLNWEYSAPNTNYEFYVDNGTPTTWTTVGQWTGALSATSTTVGAASSAANLVWDGKITIPGLLPGAIMDAATRTAIYEGSGLS